MIYFALAVGSRAVKIGFTGGDPNARIAQLSTGCPFELVPLLVELGDAVDESRLHTRFEHLRQRGEWFHLRGELLEHLTDLLVARASQDAFQHSPDRTPYYCLSLERMAKEIGGEDADTGTLWRVHGERTWDSSGGFETRYLVTRDPMGLPAIHERLRQLSYYRLISLQTVWDVPTFVTETQRAELVRRLDG